MKVDFTELTKRMSSNRKLLQAFKNTAVATGQVQLGSELRELEKEKFPKAKDADKKYQETEKFALLLRMVGISCTQNASYKILAAARAYAKMGGSFDLKTASKISAEADEIFGE